MTIDFTDQVAIITGAGNGLGRAYALALAERGAKIVVNDLGGSVAGDGRSICAAQETVALIQAMGGDAIASDADVTNYGEVESMVADAMAQWGRVDILINNAGILRDKSFTKMELDDFRQVMDVHLMGGVNCCKAVWDIMRTQKYGRIVMTASSTGLYGNFGQSNYGAAKMALIGLMNTLVLEGKKYNIRVNTLSPVAATRMTEKVVTDEIAKAHLTSQAVTAGLLSLCNTHSPNRAILCAGGGAFTASHMMDTGGIYLSPEDQTPERVMEKWNEINDMGEVVEFSSGSEHVERFIQKALNAE